MSPPPVPLVHGRASKYLDRHFNRQAMKGLEEENFPAFHHGISKSMAIITEFSNSLNHNIGGDIAENLDALYNFMVRELTQANLHKNMEKLKVVDRLLVDLRATWGEAIETNSRDKIVVNRLITNSSASFANGLPDGYVPLSISR